MPANFLTVRRSLKALMLIASSLSFVYLSLCLFLWVRQRHLIYRPYADVALRPSAPDFNLQYQTVQIPVENSSDYSGS